MRYLLTLFALLLPATQTLAQSISGSASVIDGDSLFVSGVEVRLHGIDAPEDKQTCERDGEAWRCGEAAAQRLRELVAGARVECRGQGRDAYGRIVANCSAGYADLNKTMVEQGWATAFRKYSDAYVPEETRARQAGLGIWTSTFVPPEQFRETNRSAERVEPLARPVATRPRPMRGAASVGQGCAIKGNHSRKGDWIYHLPGMPYYEQTVPEAMFCTEAEAVAAGYRRSRADRQ